MHELYKLRDMLCKELEEYGEKGEMSAGTLDVVDKLAHALKNIDKIITYKEEDDDGYSSRAYPYMGGSYARGRRNPPRDSMGRYSGNGYSRDGGMIEELRELMRDAPNDSIKRDIQRLVEKLEQQ